MINILFNAKRAERKPIEMMLVGIFYSTLSIFLAYWIFPNYVSIVMVFLTVFSCIYVIQGAITLEEKKERRKKSEGWILKEHSKLLIFLLFLFIGFVLAYAFWSFILPNDMVSTIFSIQNSSVTNVRLITGGVVSNNSSVSGIIFNNLKVLFFSLVFALFYGAGAIFVLVWNASVVGFVIGSFARQSFGIMGIPVGFAKYFLHLIPEILSYLTIALAGGIVYTAVWKGDMFNSKRYQKIVLDVIILTLLSVILLIGAGLIEVYISPYI